MIRLFSFILLNIPIILNAQKIHGNVWVFNSGYYSKDKKPTPIKDVSIVPKCCASPKTTGDDGGYSMEFQGTSRAQLTITKKKFELVNVNQTYFDLNQDDVHDFYMYDIEKRKIEIEEIQKESIRNYEKVTNQITLKLQKKSVEQQILLNELGKRFNKSNLSVLEAIALIKEARENQKKIVEGVVPYILKINLDIANKTTIKAYEAYRVGNYEDVIKIVDQIKNIEGTLSEWDREDDLIRKRQEVKRKVRNEIATQQILKAKAAYALFDYKVAELSYQLAIKADTLNMDNLFEFGLFHYQMGNFDQATYCYKKCLNILNSSLNKEYELISQVNNFISVAYSKIPNADSAIIYAEKSIECSTSNANNVSSILSGAYINLSNALMIKASMIIDTTIKNKLLSKAMSNTLKAIQIDKEDSNNVNLGFDYLNASNLYSLMGNHLQAMVYDISARPILEKANNLEALAHVYSNLASYYSNDFGDPTMELFKNDTVALKFTKASVEISERILYNKHRDLGVNYYFLGLQYFKLDSLSQSVYYYKKAKDINHYNDSLNNTTSIYTRMLDSCLINTYNLSGRKNMLLGNYKDAVKDFENLEEISNYIYDGIHFNLGVCCYKVRDFSKSVKYFEMALDSRNDYIQNCIQFYLSLAYKKNGQIDKAEHAMKIYQIQVIKCEDVFIKE